MKSYMFTWILRLVVAGLFLQTLFFKFTAAPDSIYIFSKLGAEPYGRIATGILELLAAVLILLPRTVLKGALLSIGLISGAILSHIFILGIEIQNDGGALFILALIIFVASSVIVYQYRSQLSNLFKLKS
ncbi:MAG TPA: DoxX family protein [Flavobacterium sp.]|nr:DoxX family protein [Flavobacterium sp.]